MGKTITAVAIGAVAGALIIGTYGAASGPLSALSTSLGSFAASSLGVGLSAAAAGGIAGGLIAGTLAIASSVLAPGLPSISRPGGGVASNFRQPIVNMPIVYGRARVGGPVIFYHARQVTESDETVDYRYLIIALAGHEIQEIEEIWLNDTVVTLSSNLVTDGNYANACWIYGQTGTTSDTPPSVFTSETSGRWTSSHQGKGIAKLYLKFKLTDDVISQGIPKITAVIKGKKDIYDPRDESTGYTDNAALCIYDWMLTPRTSGGFGLSSSANDWDHVSTEADVCDESVALSAGGTESRYTCNGVIDTGAGADTIRDGLVQSMAGEWTVEEGIFKAYAGRFITVSESISENNISGAIQYDPLISDADRFNTVRGVFVSEDHAWQPIEFPTIETDASEERVTIDMELPFTKSGTMAQRISKINLLRSQMQRSLSFPMNVAGLSVETLNNVTVNHPRYAHIGNLAWSVRSWRINGDFSIGLELREESEDIYAWDTTDEQEIRTPALALVEPDISAIGSSVAPTSFTVTTASSSSIDYQFTMPSSSSTGWILYRSTTNDIDTATSAGTGSAVAGAVVSGTDTGLSASTTYYYWVKTFNFVGFYGGGLSVAAGPQSDTTSA